MLLLRAVAAALPLVIPGFAIAALAVRGMGRFSTVGNLGICLYCMSQIVPTPVRWLGLVFGLGLVQMVRRLRGTVRQAPEWHAT